VLINSGSLVSKIPAAYASAYVVAKQGVRALGASLREELALEGARDIHVCTLMPASIDTPFFQHAADYTGRRVKPMPPVYGGRISTTPAGILDPCMVNASIPWASPGLGLDQAGCMLLPTGNARAISWQLDQVWCLDRVGPLSAATPLLAA
jgi:NAD(P)-dependent dehydrogenase (short-subunit alcohol dehydrogenase family)